MKNYIMLIGATLISTGCSVLDTQSVIQLTKKDFSGKNYDDVIATLKKDGFYCQLTRIGNNPLPIFKKFTLDGTLNELKVHQCMKQSDYFFWMTTAYTYTMGQYDKVVGVGHMGSYQGKSYLWDTTPRPVTCITKCLTDNSGILK